MPKKMARLDESTDYRPFKFRIQAFTNAFQEEVCLPCIEIHAAADEVLIIVAKSRHHRGDNVWEENQDVFMAAGSDISI
jgi:hypothetical protein